MECEDVDVDEDFETTIKFRALSLVLRIWNTEVLSEVTSEIPSKQMQIGERYSDIPVTGCCISGFG